MLKNEAAAGRMARGAAQSSGAKACATGNRLFVAAGALLWGFLGFWSGVTKADSSEAEYHAGTRPGDPEIGLGRLIAGPKLLLPPPEHRKCDNQEGKRESLEPITWGHERHPSDFTRKTGGSGATPGCHDPALIRTRVVASENPASPLGY